MFLQLFNNMSVENARQNNAITRVRNVVSEKWGHQMYQPAKPFDAIIWWPNGIFTHLILIITDL